MISFSHFNLVEFIFYHGPKFPHLGLDSPATLFERTRSLDVWLQMKNSASESTF